MGGGLVGWVAGYATLANIVWTLAELRPGVLTL